MSNSNPPQPTAPVFDPFANYDAHDYLTQEERDEIIARRLQEQEDEAFNSSLSSIHRSMTRGTGSNRSAAVAPQSEPPTSMASGGLSDTELARRVEIEMNDEIYARQLQQKERMKQVKVTTTTNDIARAQLEQGRSKSDG